MRLYQAVTLSQNYTQLAPEHISNNIMQMTSYSTTADN